MCRRCTHFSAEFLRRQPCRPCVHCHGWIDERGRVLSDAAALRRYPQHTAEIQARPMTPLDQLERGLGEQVAVTIMALLAVAWRLALLVLAAPFIALAFMLCWSLITS
jgi:hypothetical protein